MYLGVDLGTSSVKALLIDERGVIVGEGSASLSLHRPHQLWAEQDPQDWLSAATVAVCGLPAAQRAKVQAIGLTGQMHGATLLDAADKPLRPAILWNDGRAFAEAAAMEAAAPSPRAITGNAVMPGFTSPKLKWVAAHEPALFAQTRTVLLPKDYLRLAWTGEKATDMSDAAGTLWLDVAARDWSDALLAQCALGRAHMPRLLEGPQIFGRLTAAASAALGIPAVPVIAGGGDNAASAIGVGLIAPGQAFLSLGTSGVLFVVDPQFAPNPGRGVHAFCHALPGLWHRMAVMLSAASAVDFAVRFAGYSAISEVMNDLDTPHPDDPIFLPYLSGERTPHNDAHATGVYFGLRHSTERAGLVRAALEGVAFAMADGLDALGAESIGEICVVGGGARLGAWGPILATALGRTLLYRKGGEAGAALGAARLAQLGGSGAALSDVCRPGALKAEIAPSPQLAAFQSPRRAIFQRLYRDLALAFHQHGSAALSKEVVA
jgi:xylulokinase